MLENVNVNSIKVNGYVGAFMGSELQRFAEETILTQFVQMSQEKGEWVTEVTFEEFARRFIGASFFQNAEEFCSCIITLEVGGYLEIKDGETSKEDILKVTEKFEKLCEKYAA